MATPGADAAIAPAPRVAAGVSVLTIAALTAALTASLPLPWRLAVALAACAVGVRAVAGLLRPRWRRIRIDGSGLLLECASGRRVAGRVAGQPFVSPLYVGLRWRPEAGRLPRTIGLFREQLSPRDYRRLCVALRFPGIE